MTLPIVDKIYTQSTGSESAGHARPGGTHWRSDGNFYIADSCERCKCRFYVHALANRIMGAEAYELCPWCKGECSAAEQDRRNAAIESA